MNRYPTIYHIQYTMGRERKIDILWICPKFSGIHLKTSSIFTSTSTFQYFFLNFIFFSSLFLSFKRLSIFIQTMILNRSGKKESFALKSHTISPPLPLLHINAAQTNIVMLVVCSEFVPQICYWPNFFFVNIYHYVYILYTNRGGQRVKHYTLMLMYSS